MGAIAPVHHPVCLRALLAPHLMQYCHRWHRPQIGWGRVTIERRQEGQAITPDGCGQGLAVPFGLGQLIISEAWAIMPPPRGQDLFPSPDGSDVSQHMQGCMQGLAHALQTLEGAHSRHNVGRIRALCGPLFEQPALAKAGEHCGP